MQGSTVTRDDVVASHSLLEDDITKLWHMSKNGMTKLSRRGLLDGHKTNKLQFCEHCVSRKQKRVRFSSGIHKSKGSLDYLHSDL